MLDNGLTYDAIIQRLVEPGRHLNYHNLKQWRKGGYQDYLKAQARKQSAKVRDLYALKIIESTPASDLAATTLQLLSKEYFDVLLNFDAKQLETEMKTNGTSYTRLLNSMTRVSNIALALKKQSATKCS